MKRKKQIELLLRIAQSLEQTNELLQLQLTPVAAKHYQARLKERKSRKSAAVALEADAPR